VISGLDHLDRRPLGLGPLQKLCGLRIVGDGLVVAEVQKVTSS
jgi:hypothetical protein